MSDLDIRWNQRLRNFNKAIKKLDESVRFVNFNHLENNHLKKDENFNHIHCNLIKQGLIQSFEFTHELAWNVIKDYAAFQGNPEIRGSRDATREGFSMGIIENGEVWMEMIKSRNETSHTYDEATATDIFQKIINDYLPAF
ncbi:MAG: nucleotidyltransferase substrate binding protein [Cytophagales bacterium]